MGVTDLHSLQLHHTFSFALKEWLGKVRPEFIALLVLLTFQIYLISSSNGFYYIDEGAHFMDDYAALRDPSVSIGVWQRFGSIWFFTLPAQFGHVTVKVFASITFLLIIFVAYKIAELEEIPYKEWIIVLAGFQPVFLDISFTCLAELPATLFLVLAYYLYRTSRWKLSLTVASAVFLCRYEMSILAIMIFFVALYRRKYATLPFVLLGPALALFHQFREALTAGGRHAAAPTLVGLDGCGPRDAIRVNRFDGSDGAVNAVTFSLQLGEDLFGVHSFARW